MIGINQLRQHLSILSQKRYQLSVFKVEAQLILT